MSLSRGQVVLRSAPMRNWCCWALLLLVLPAGAAELKIEFGDFHEGEAPPGFRSTVAGKGKPGQWNVIAEEVAPLLAPLTSQPSPSHTSHHVLAQLALDPTDEHFPMLIYEGDRFGDFTLTTRLKTVRGVIEQMAGIVFRVQNESNYYVVRASSLDGTFRFYKMRDGQRGLLVGPKVEIPSGVWQDVVLQCKGNEIHCRLNGKEIISVTDRDTPFLLGKIGFWTKSDSVSYFGDTAIDYIPSEPAAQKLVREVLHHYPRLLGLKIYVAGTNGSQPRVIASGDPHELGQPGGSTEQEVIGRSETYFGREKDVVSVIMPLRDRNGDAMAAVRVVMKGFPGQTEENAIIRAAPIVKRIQERAQTLDDLLD